MQNLNINSYADNLYSLTKSAEGVLEVAQGLNEAMLGTDASIQLKNGMALPSFTNIIKRVSRVENTISKFTQGKGVIETDDGTYRKIKVSTISRPPQNVGQLDSITTFGIDPNWFFESLQYPKCVVKLDLKGNIDDDSDRVYVDRIILDANTVTAGAASSMLEYYRTNIAGNNISYNDLISKFENDGVEYREDKDEISLPLTYEKYKGEFGVLEIRLVKDANGISREWIFLDNITYSSIDSNGLTVNSGYTLQVNDYLRFANSLYKITHINPNQKCIRVEYAVGYETVGAGDILEFYNEPFSEKVIEIGIGIDEINIIYVKGVNEEYNLLSKDWSYPISFYTNELILEDNANITFAMYYTDKVSDFGRTWIAQAREKQIYAFNGLVPYAPVLDEKDLKVVQINTQLNATLDSETYTNLTSEITKTKSNITSTRSTIASNKDLLIQSTSPDERANIQNLINSDTETLNSLTTQYNSLVEELNTLLNESGAISYSPKYHIRGFFAIPSPRYVDEVNLLGQQSVIGFDVMYRYLHTDETGVSLVTYEYTDQNDILQTGVFTDWNIMTSEVLEKKYDEETKQYVWTQEKTSDGSKININQIDIPIRSGEKVEIKVRSISEAGYPYNPVKSDWSNSVIISFPENLTSNDSVTKILETVKSDLTAVTLQETLSAAGVYTHIADSNSQYKHAASNVSYTDSTTDDNNNTTLNEMSVQDKIDALSKKMATLKDELKDMFDDQIEKLSGVVYTLKQNVGYTDMEEGDIESGTTPFNNIYTNLFAAIKVNASMIEQIKTALGITTNI